MGEGKKSFWEQVAIILGAVTAMLVAVTGLMVTYRTLSAAEVSNASAIKNEEIKAADTSDSARTLSDQSGLRQQASAVPRETTRPPQEKGVNRQEAAAQAPIIVAPIEPTRTGCERENMLRSPESTHPVQITFSNGSDHPIWVYWIDSAGNRVPGTVPGQRFGLLHPGGETTIRSREDDVWVLADQQSLCRRVVIVGDEDSTYVYR